MTVDLTALFDWAAPFILIFTRCVGLMAAGPVLGAEMAPMRIRAAVALFLALLLFPQLSPGMVSGLLGLVLSGRYS